MRVYTRRTCTSEEDIPRITSESETPQEIIDVSPTSSTKIEEEVYMEIPPGYSRPEVIGHVCRLKKSLYSLKQSPRAWFDRFKRALCVMHYKQCNGDHTLFYRHLGARSRC